MLIIIMNFNKASNINNKYYNWYCKNINIIKHLYTIMNEMCNEEGLIIKENKNNYLDFCHMIYINSNESNDYRKYIDHF